VTETLSRGGTDGTEIDHLMLGNWLVTKAEAALPPTALISALTPRRHPRVHLTAPGAVSRTGRAAGESHPRKEE
jgi:hypothetical protein